MTPDERADRAERVIRETLTSFRSTAAWLRREEPRVCTTAVGAIELCADELACHARIAGIHLDEPTR